MLKLRLDYYLNGGLHKRLGVLRIWGASVPTIANDDDPFSDEPQKRLTKGNKDWQAVYEALGKVYGKR